MSRPPVSLTVGEALEPRSIGPITQTDIVRFAGAGGDLNPLHHDETYAKNSGLPGVISIGQFQAGLLAAWLSDLVGVEYVLRFSVRFAAPLFIGDVLAVDGDVTEVTEEGIALLSLRGARGSETIITGTATVRVRAAGLTMQLSDPARPGPAFL